MKTTIRKVDLLWFTLISEVLTNLCAGWIGLGLTALFTIDKGIFEKLGLLTVNISFAIVSLVAAFKLRKKVKR